MANNYVMRLNEHIRTAAENRGATVVDIVARDSDIRADADNYANCNHLSEQGNTIAAEVFHEAITASTE